MRTLLLLLTVIVFSKQLAAQTYPYSENFTLQVSNQVPAGWQGDIKVLLAHGTNDSKCIAAKLSSTIPVASVSTPLIGPLTSLSSITFFYRIVDQLIYPSTPTNLVTGDLFQVQISNNNSTYQNILQIDENNHNPNLNFIKKKIYLSQFSGDTVHFKFNCAYANNAGYFIDIDSIVVKDEPATGIESMVDSKEFSMFPNPCNIHQELNIVCPNSDSQRIGIYNIAGQLVVNRQFQNSTTIAAGTLPKGTYSLQVGNHTEKLVVIE